VYYIASLNSMIFFELSVMPMLLPLGPCRGAQAGPSRYEALLPPFPGPYPRLLASPNLHGVNSWVLFFSQDRTLENPFMVFPLQKALGNGPLPISYALKV
jgi:hypothetical protein